MTLDLQSAWVQVQMKNLASKTPVLEGWGMAHDSHDVRFGSSSSDVEHEHCYVHTINRDKNMIRMLNPVLGYLANPPMCLRMWRDDESRIAWGHLKHPIAVT